MNTRGPNLVSAILSLLLYAVFLVIRSNGLGSTKPQRKGCKGVNEEAIIGSCLEAAYHASGQKKKEKRDQIN